MKDRWNLDRFKYGICNVPMMYDHYFKFLLGKCHMLFEWHNLPETIDKAYLNNTLFIDGDICFTEFDGKLYCCSGAQGGKQDAYYYGTTYQIANPVLGTKAAKVDEDCVVMYNSPVEKARFLGGGLYSLISSTATQLADNEVSIQCAQINTRVQSIVTASDESIAKGAEMVLKDKYNGKPYAVVTDDITDNVIRVNATPAPSGVITELVELQQSIMANFYQAIGVKMNAIRKKQRMITDEINSQDDYIAVSIMEMLEARQEAVEKINAMFGTEISVNINPILEPEDENAPESTTEPVEDVVETEDSNYTTEAEEPVESTVEADSGIIEKALDVIEAQVELTQELVEAVVEDEPKLDTEPEPEQEEVSEDGEI